MHIWYTQHKHYLNHLSTKIHSAQKLKLENDAHNAQVENDAQIAQNPSNFIY